MKRSDGHKAANASLWLAICGVLWPVLFSKSVDMAILGLLFVPMEVAAFIAGVIGRRHTRGKAGLTVSSLFLVLIVIGFGFWFGLRPKRTLDRDRIPPKVYETHNK